MAEVSYAYAFTHVDGRYQPYLPLRIVNPDKKLSINCGCLIDTGADKCVFPENVCTILGHNLNGDGVKSSFNSGISGITITTWQHTFLLELIHPTSRDIVWQSERLLIDCTEHNDLPVILGTEDFLKHFRITIDYPEKMITVTFDTED